MNKAISTSLQISLLAFCHLFSITPKSLAEARLALGEETSPSFLAQVTSDGTVNTQVTQDGNSAEITGGETRGGNLFHSFQDFSVTTGNEAFFDNANDVSNIFSRVTGGNISNIDGAIRANGSANLFLINPAGIIFGENARLDIGGSFYGSTASSVLFEDGEFSAADLENPPILTVNAPVGLGFRDEPGDITLRGDGNGTRLADSEIIDTQDALRVSGDATIGFIGGNLNFENATVKTAGGRIELGSVAGGRVDLVEAENGFSFDYSNVETFQDISLSGRSNIDASGNGGGNINVTGKNVFLAGVSGLVSHTLGDSAGGDIDVFATDEILISGVENEDNFLSGIFNRVFANATANGGDINIETGSLSIGDRAGIFTDTRGRGNAGDITINATDSVSLESQGNSTQIASSVAADAIGNGGDITINAQNYIQLAGQDNQVFITSRNLNENSNLNAGNITFSTTSLDASNGILFSNHSGQGNAGNISINTSGDVNLLNNSVLSASGTDGNSGNIEINANSLIVSDSSLAILTNSLGTGTGGNVLIDTTENISFSNSSSINVAGTPGGIIDITAKNLSLTSESTFFAGTKVDSQSSDDVSGDITINLSEDLTLDSANNNESITSIDNSNRGQGNAGNILINARNISILNGGIITNGTLSDGNIGDIVLNATEDITIDGSSNFRSTVNNQIDEEATGNTGEIRVSANNLTLSNGGGIQSFVRGRANSGDINLDIADTITIEGFAELTSRNNINETIMLSSGITSSVGLGAVGNGGDININTKNLFISRNGEISTDIIQAQGTGGDIKIDADLITIGEQESSFLSTSDISSSTFRDVRGDNPFTEATAGNIEINTGSLFIREGAAIDASTLNLGNAGNITINATDTVSVSGSSVLISPEGEEVEILSNITSGVLLDAIGDGGELTVNTSKLILDNGSILASTDGQGNAGNIILNASESITLNNEVIISSSAVDNEVIGNAGNIKINTSQLSLNNESQINSFTRGQGKAGSINIDVEELSIDNQSAISTSTFGQGNAGNLTIDASESIELSGTSDDGSSGLFASALIEDGNGGDLQIFTQDLIIRDGATINVSNFPSVEGIAEPGTGEAGNLTVETNSLRIEDGGRINAATQAGNGGNITLDVAENIILRDTGFISARALKDANGGNINIDTDFIIAFPQGNNDIIATAERGNGGNININAESLFGIEERPLNGFSNDINASSEFSLDGTVNITNPNINPAQGAVELPSNVVELGENTQQACEANRESVAKNELNITGKGGILPEPGLPLNSLNVTVNGETDTTPITPQPIETIQGKVQPARGLKLTESGEIILTAHRTSNSGDRISEAKRNCGQV